MTLALPSHSGGLAPTSQYSFATWTHRPVYPSGLYPSDNEEEKHARRLLIPATLPLQTDFKSTNVVFWGRRGKGKTLSMVGISKILALGFYKVGWRIQANIPLDFADIGIPNVNCHPLLGSFFAADMDKASDSLVDFDELTEIVPSKKAMSRVNIDSNSVMVQIRKLQCEVMGTTQFPTDVQRQMLRQLDLWVLCEAWIPKDARWNARAAARAFVKLTVFDLWGQFTDNYLASKYFPPPLHLAMKTIYLHNLPGAWHSYKSHFKVISEHASADTQERMVSRHWDITKLQEAEATDYDHLMQTNPAERDFSAEVEARVQEAKEHPTEPPPAESYSLAPQTLDAWMRQKRPGKRMAVTLKMVSEIQRFLPNVRDMQDALRVFEVYGWDTDLSDGKWHIEAR